MLPPPQSGFHCLVFGTVVATQHCTFPCSAPGTCCCLQNLPVLPQHARGHAWRLVFRLPRPRVVDGYEMLIMYGEGAMESGNVRFATSQDLQFPAHLTCVDLDSPLFSFPSAHTPLPPQQWFGDTRQSHPQAILQGTQSLVPKSSCLPPNAAPPFLRYVSVCTLVSHANRSLLTGA